MRAVLGYAEDGEAAAGGRAASPQEGPKCVVAQLRPPIPLRCSADCHFVDRSARTLRHASTGEKARGVPRPPCPLQHV